MNINADENGLVPAIAQDEATGQVLMLGFVSEESLNMTFENSQVWCYSRSRSSLWHKGETSGNFLTVKSIDIDCDHDAILLKVAPMAQRVTREKFRVSLRNWKQPQTFSQNQARPTSWKNYMKLFYPGKM